jgi:aminoglycoside phosphotransferase (APT) family kinase protein
VGHALEDTGFVQAWFRARADRLGAPEKTIEVLSVEAFSRGVSRQTWRVAAAVDGTRRDLAVRRDHEAGSVIPTKLHTEYQVYSALTGTDVPHAAPLWWENEDEWMPDGRPAYVRQLVEGHWKLPVLAEDPAKASKSAAEHRIALAHEHLRRLAQVHAVDWEKAGLRGVLPVPPGPAEAAPAIVQDCAAKLAGYGPLSVAAAEAVQALLERAPRDLYHLVLCKGTNGHGEEVWRDGRIVAMSDWELAAIGDPAYDFAQCQELLADVVVDGQRCWGMPEALAFYRTLTGTRITMERVAYYRELVALLQHVYARHAAWVVSRLDAAPVRFVWTATEVSFRSEQRLAAAYAGDLITEQVA